MLLAWRLCGGGNAYELPGWPHSPWEGDPRAPTAATWAIGGKAPSPGGPLATRNPRGPPGLGLACGPWSWRHAAPATDGTVRTLRSPPPSSCVDFRPVRRSGASSPRYGRDAARARGAPSGPDGCAMPLPIASPRLFALPPDLSPHGSLAPLGVVPGVVPGPPWLSSVPAARGASVGQEQAHSSSRSHGRRGRKRACSDIPALVPPV